MAGAAAATLAAINVALTRIGIAPEALAVMNVNQVTHMTSLIGL